MAATITFELSTLPPSTNALWRVAAGGHGYKSARYAAWCEAAGWELAAQKPGRIEGNYAIALRFVAPDRRPRDLDNLCKPVSDLLVSAGAIESDHLARKITLEWAAEGPAVWGQITATKRGCNEA